MPAATPSTQKEYWDDWLDPDSPPAQRTYTLPELLADLAQRGVSATENDLEFWQRRGVLPYPRRRRHDGATRALYPVAAAVVIQQLRLLQRQGYSLAQIATRVRRYARSMYERDPADAARLAPVLVGLARERAARTGIPCAFVGVFFEDAEGDQETHAFPVPPTEEEDVPVRLNGNNV